MQQEASKKILFTSKSPRALFKTVLLRIMESTDMGESLLGVRCFQDHSFRAISEQIITSFSNCMFKNLVSGLNDSLHAASTGGGRRRESQEGKKLQKLNSN